jgi:hypothetical protein
MLNPPAFLRSVVAASAALVALAPAAAQTLDVASRTVTVSPSGADDTSSIATAFAMCQDLGPGCTVQLTEGTFLTRQQDIEGFVGTFAGAGREATVVQALTPYVVSPPRNDVSIRAPDRGGAPVMFTIREGDIVIRDLTFVVRGAAPSLPWLFAGTEINTIAVVLSFEGLTNRGVVERVAIEAERVGAFGVNVFNGIFVLPGPNNTGDVAVAELVVHDTRITGTASGISLSALQDSSVRIVGTDLDAEQALEINNVGASSLMIVDNRLVGRDGPVVGVGVGAGFDVGGPLYVWIAGNDIVARGSEARGIDLSDQSGSGVAVVHVSGNRFELDGARAGVRGGSLGTVVFGNAFTGSAETAVQVGVNGGGGWMIAANDLGGLVTQQPPIMVQRWTAEVIVVCSGQGQLADRGAGTIALCQ